MAVRAAAQTGGLPPEWEVRKSMSELADHVKRLAPVLEQAKPQEWVSRGAPAAYVEQGKRVRAEIEYLIGSTEKLSQKPESLTTALETYFRLLSVDSMLRSYSAGIRRYQNAPLAELLDSLISPAAADREKLRQYLVELAAVKEMELKVMDQEAQRCRAVLSRQPRGARKEER
jgi:hypothetical protein